MVGELVGANIDVRPNETLLEPDRLPGRPERPTLVSPKDVPQRALGSVDGRAALLHALAHIEFNAIKTVYNEWRSSLQTKTSWQKPIATFDFQVFAKRLAIR